LVWTAGYGESESSQLPHSSLGDDYTLWADVQVNNLLHVVEVSQRFHDLNMSKVKG